METSIAEQTVSSTTVPIDESNIAKLHRLFLEENNMKAFPKSNDDFYVAKLAYAADKFDDAMEFICKNFTQEAIEKDDLESSQQTTQTDRKSETQVATEID